MTEPTFGISFLTDDSEPRPAVGSDMSVVGIVAPSPHADPDAFPLNTPVLVFSDQSAATAKLGAGPIYDAFEAINEQLAELQIAAKVVVVRVAEGANIAETIANIVGDANTKTGIHALVDAGTILGVVPRLICAPGYTAQRFGGIDHFAGLQGGENYVTAPTVTFTGGTPIRPARATANLTAGAVSSITIDDPGEYLTPPVVGFDGGGGTGAAATAVLEQLANPICTALPAMLDKILGVAVIDGPGTNRQDAVDWRETISSKRIIPVVPATKVMAADGSIAIKPLSPYVIGRAVRRDYEKGGFPFHSWANQPINGIIGPSRGIAFSLTDGATEGQDLLSNNIGVLIRGEAGVETAIAEGGFVYVGTDTCADDELWRFYNVVRGRDYIHLLFLRTLRYYLGKFNITGQTVQSVLNTMEFALRDLKADQHILGYKVGFTKDQNSPENLRLGKFTVRFQAEEPPVLRRLVIQSARYRPALDALLNDLLTQLELAA
jgi:phage tail sheath protein FI